jgi:hypothetical protein
MTRLPVLPALLALAAVSSAQEAPIRLQLTPMPAPVPALRYYLYPELRDQNPGNAVQAYYRAFSPEWFGSLSRDVKKFNRLTDLSDKPLREFNPSDLKEISEFTGWKMLEEIDRAARRPNYDWELTERARTEGYELRLPDVQSMRTFAFLLRLRSQSELSKREFHKAARTLQTGLAMGRHVANGPTLIQGLVGIAIATKILHMVDDWVNLPDAPNLYWALTNLPHPLIDLRSGVEGERLMLDSLFPGYREMLADPSIPPPSAQQLQQILQKLLDLQIQAGGPSNSLHGLKGIQIALQDYPEAKRFLLEHGRTIEQVEAMPVLHAVFLYETYKYDLPYDDIRKSFGLPYPEAFAIARESAKRFANSESARRQDVAGLLLPAVERVMVAPARIERKIAALRCVEAIRLHAATNGGKLPENLTEVTEVPVPIDPWTGKAFEYRLDGTRAFLTGPTPKGEQPSANNSIHYELTIRLAKGEK